jgi:hypothetical protein
MKRGRFDENFLRLKLSHGRPVALGFFLLLGSSVRAASSGNNQERLLSFKRFFFSSLCELSLRSQWPRDLRHELSSLARTLVSWVRIPSRHGCLSAFILCVVLRVGSGLATRWSPVQGVLSTVYGLRNWKNGQGQKGCRAILRVITINPIKHTRFYMYHWFLH